MGLRCEEKGLCYKLLYTGLNVKLDGNAVYVCTTHSLQNFTKSINFVDRMVDIFINNLEVLNSNPNYACNL